MMLKQLVIYLPSDDLTQARWVTLDESHTVHTEGRLEELTPELRSLHTSVIVPARDVLLTQATLPKLSRHRLSQALPFALEEQVVDELSDLHFAIGDYSTEGNYPVAIVSHDKMRQWLSALDALHISPSVIVPETFAIPVTEHGWTLLLTDETGVVREDETSGFAFDLPNLHTVLALRLQEIKTKPTMLTIHHVGESPYILELSDITITETNHPIKKYVRNLAMWLKEPPPINLLQSTYPPKRHHPHIKKVWLATVGLAAGLVIFAFLSNVISFFILEMQVHHLNKDIQRIYQHHFPQATSTVAPKQRMAEKLHSLEKESGQNPFLIWLAYLAKAMQQAKDIHLQHLDFHQNQMTLDLSAPSFDRLDAFLQALSAQGLNVKQHNTILVGTQVKTSLQITEGGA